MKRKDYLKNLRSKRPSGCTWCGRERTGVSEYCSDTCLQMDMDGIDDSPPVFMLAYNKAQGGEAYVSRKIAEYNAAYGGKTGDEGDEGAVR